jgi:hypothetical protein
MVCTLLAYKRGEPRVCAMVKPPTGEEEDRLPSLPRAQSVDRWTQQFSIWHRT